MGTPPQDRPERTARCTLDPATVLHVEQHDCDGCIPIARARAAEGQPGYLLRAASAQPPRNRPVCQCFPALDDEPLRRSLRIESLANKAAHAGVAGGARHAEEQNLEPSRQAL